MFNRKLTVPLPSSLTSNMKTQYLVSYSASVKRIGPHQCVAVTCVMPCRFWVNNQSRMYLLEGMAELQRHYRVKMGDVLVFAQKDDRTIVLAGRPATKSDVAKRPPVRKPQPVPAAQGTPKQRGREVGTDMMRCMLHAW